MKGRVCLFALLLILSALFAISCDDLADNDITDGDNEQSGEGEGEAVFFGQAKTGGDKPRPYAKILHR